MDKFLNPDNIKSSKKAAKMARKLVRKQANEEARLEVGKFQQILQEKLAIFNEVLKPRPKWIPQKVWHYFAEIFIDIDSVQSKLQFPTSVSVKQVK